MYEENLKFDRPASVKIDMDFRREIAICGNHAGFSLIQIVMVTAIVSVMILAISTMTMSALKDTKNIRALSSRDTLKRNLDRYALDPMTLALSVAGVSLAPGNQKLKYCLEGPVAGCQGYPNCCSNVTTEFNMVDPGEPTALLGGTTASPALFDGEGTPCTGSKCIHSVVTSFKAECAGGAATCARADGIRVNYKLEPTSFANTAADVPRMKAHERTLASLAPGTFAAESPRYSETCSDWRRRPGQATMSACKTGVGIWRSVTHPAEERRLAPKRVWSRISQRART